MRIVFFGSDDFAAVHLEKLLASGQEVLCCVTAPDKPQGRGMKLSLSPIKQIASRRHFPCLQPLSLKEHATIETLKSYSADIFVVVAYGRLLTQEVLDIPKILCLNVHGSLLPQYRGAAPVNWAILNGEKQTGVTVQKMALALDAGDIVAQEVMTIGEGENAAQLRMRMAVVGAQLLAEVLDGSPSGRFSLISQDETKVSWAPKLTKDMGLIDWHRPAQSIIHQVHGLQPWPGAYTFCNGKMIKVTQIQMSTEGKGQHPPGEVVKIDRNGFYVACADKAVLIKELQPEAGKVMPASSFVAGYKVGTDTTFSNRK